MLLAHSKEVKICSEYIRIQLHKKMYSTSDLFFFFYIWFWRVFFLTFNYMHVSKTLPPNISYLRSLVTMSELLEEKKCWVLKFFIPETEEKNKIWEKKEL